MQKPDVEEILSLFRDGNEDIGYIFEVYEAIIEFIKSGKAIPDMGHGAFYMGGIS